MGMLSNKIDQKQLKPGDHIYSWRQAYLYSHHGIYVGDGMVINFTTGAVQQAETPTIFERFFTSSAPKFNTPCSRCCYGSRTRTDGVIKSCLDCFLSGGELYLFQYGVSYTVFLAQVRGGTCTLASSDPTEEVLRCTFYLLENGFGGYNVLKNNCEDFAIYCKTGLLVPQSGQAASYLAAASSMASSSSGFLMSGIFGMTFFGCGTYCIKRLVFDIGFRHEVIKDVTKVPVEKILEMARGN
ncbi:hypothetical protein TSUD_124050 [Trifolium subterraneum]|uniref:LRAT domain-containing protein n=1 Tax=Trifolium subterraneum TaxID=3900 RepID=A0A2Z6NHX2_TRISU|nr:hypothetical protein TSUD_124050 [Trifolium subterraneum]